MTLKASDCKREHVNWGVDVKIISPNVFCFFLEHQIIGRLREGAPVENLGDWVK